MKTENFYQETDLGNISPNPRGDYDASAEYEYLDQVFMGGGSYLCRAEFGAKITGIAPEPGKTTNLWQCVAIPGDLTPEYIAMHDDVVNKAESVSEDAKSVEEMHENVIGMEINVREIQKQTEQFAEDAESSKDGAAGYAREAEASRQAASESEANINAQVDGFDTHVEEKTEESIGEVDKARRAAIGAVTAQQTASIREVKDQTSEFISQKQADAENAIEDKADEYKVNLNFAIKSIQNAGNNQVKNVEDVGSKQVAELQKYKGVKISDAEPTEEEVGVWIDPNDDEEYQIPEIKDDEESEVDTWSSKKIKEGFSALKEDLTELNEHLEVKKCYLNYDSFTTDGYYYNNNLVPTVGANFKIAEPIKLNAGIYTFYGINLYWTFAKTSNGTITRLGEGYSGTVSFDEEVTVYTTTEKGTSVHYQEARIVDGESALNEMPDVGIISSGIDTRLQNCEKISLDNASDLNILNESVGVIKCYLNYDSFGSENLYYNSSLVPTPPADGNTYAVAEPIKLKSGIYTFYGINLYWTFYVTEDGTITRLHNGDGYEKTITFDEDVTVYTTIVKLSRSDYERAMIVDGENVIAGTPNVGIIDTKMNQRIKELATSNSYTFALFENACACGDSFTQGSCVCSDGTTWKDRPWFDKIAKKCGIDYLNCGIGGSTTRTWLSNANGLQKVLNASPYDFYTLAWGINDLYASGHGLDYLGTINDITDDYTQNPDTFYGNYARIIEQIKAHSPNAKFVMFPVWYNSPNNADVQAFNTAIQNIADHYSIPYINIFEDDFFTSSEAYTMLQGHPSALGYMGMASAIERLFDKCVKENINYFRYSSVG